MNTNILRKCIEALKADAPDLSYLRGMLETLLEMQEPIIPTITKGPMQIAIEKKFDVPSQTIDEASALNALARAGIEKLKLAGQPLDQ